MDYTEDSTARQATDNLVAVTHMEKGLGSVCTEGVQKQEPSKRCCVFIAGSFCGSPLSFPDTQQS